MHIKVLDIASRGSGSHNEDRAGSAGNLAWVIDGATDLVEEPLVGEYSDAAWLAEHTQRSLSSMEQEQLDDLAELLQCRIELLGCFLVCIARFFNSIHEDFAFLMHVGDIKGGNSPCTPAELEKILVSKPGTAVSTCSTWD